MGASALGEAMFATPESPASVIQRAAKEINLPVEDLLHGNGRRTKRLSELRVLVGNLLFLTGCSNPEVGEHMHCDHTTARAWRIKLGETPALQAQFRVLAMRLGLDPECPTPT